MSNAKISSGLSRPRSDTDRTVSHAEAYKQMVHNREPTVSPHKDPTSIADTLRDLPKGSDYRVLNRPLSELAGAKADPLQKSLEGFHRRDLTAAIGTEFLASSGIQLSKLTDTQVEDLALLVAQRGVVFLREQDITEEQQKALGRKLGPLHVHPLGFSDGSKDEVQAFAFNQTTLAVAGEGWHR